MIQDTEFIGNQEFTVNDAKVSASCPSNIAIIKYWGKYENQVPANPSISYTLNNSKTNTEIEFKAGENFSVRTFLANEENSKFSEKIEKFFKSIERYLPWILQGSFVIRTENTFPHSSGIASSASGFGAIAKCLMQLDGFFCGKVSDEFHLKKTSFLARLGSGSAARSIENGLIVWGETPVVKGSSDLFAVSFPPEKIHPIFKNFNDWILLIHEGEKAVSSTLGHSLMKTNPYAERRFQEARDNFFTLEKILKSGDLQGFIKLTEHEALTLHAMMMVSDPAFILMQAGTVEVIHKIWNFRKETGLPLFFTLDAGANVHLLFPENEDSQKICDFIVNNLIKFSQKGGIVRDFMKFY